MHFKVRILDSASEYIQKLKASEQGAAKADIEAMQAGDFESVRTKQLEGKVRELIVGYHRFTYFQHKGCLYLIRGFRKKSAKTPKKEIEYAKDIYRIIAN